MDRHQIERLARKIPVIGNAIGSAINLGGAAMSMLVGIAGLGAVLAVIAPFRQFPELTFACAAALVTTE